MYLFGQEFAAGQSKLQEFASSGTSFIYEHPILFSVGVALTMLIIFINLPRETRQTVMDWLRFNREEEKPATIPVVYKSPHTGITYPLNVGSEESTEESTEDDAVETLDELRDLVKQRFVSSDVSSDSFRETIALLDQVKLYFFDDESVEINEPSVEKKE